MFSASALKAMSAEEAQDIAERTTAAAIAAETSTAVAATATVEAASIDAMLGSEGLPVQHESHRRSRVPRRCRPGLWTCTRVFLPGRPACTGQR